MLTDTIKDLYRKEFSRLVAVFSNRMGLGDIQLAEDLVSAAFLEASQRWEKDGLPDNPPHGSTRSRSTTPGNISEGTRFTNANSTS
ncbi:hypothetical protein ACQ86N_29825 [Puia sp. P3]|uniref:hypothetical protein n=1 Tax=Puia sp. P3 TaxID=3423952 RepID=UPI003D66F4BC